MEGEHLGSGEFDRVAWFFRPRAAYGFGLDLSGCCRRGDSSSLAEEFGDRKCITAAIDGLVPKANRTDSDVRCRPDFRLNLARAGGADGCPVPI